MFWIDLSKWLELLLYTVLALPNISMMGLQEEKGQKDEIFWKKFATSTGDDMYIAMVLPNTSMGLQETEKSERLKHKFTNSTILS